MNLIYFYFILSLNIQWLYGRNYLIVSIDNRNLSFALKDSQYASLNAAITSKYANYHGYDYIYVKNVANNLVHDANEIYMKSNVIPTTSHVAKDIATCFHVGLKQYRAASWAKLPALWYIVRNYGIKYDYVMYLDSDSTISPIFLDRSLDDVLLEYQMNTSKIIRGNNNILQSKLIFFNNFPWRDDMPCAGTFLMNMNDNLTSSPISIESILREWWDYDIPSKNFKHFHEQDALWHMIDSESEVDRETNETYDFKINSQTYTIISEYQFPSNWISYDKLWLCHVASYNYELRQPILYHFLRLLNIDNENSYYDAISSIYKNSMIILDKPLNITHHMEIISSSDSNRHISWPKHDETTQGIFYDSHRSSDHIPPLSPSELYNNKLIRKRGEFWLVQYGKKRGFSSYEVFLEMGFTNLLALNIKPNELNQIPDGPLFTQEDVNVNAGHAHENSSVSVSVLPLINIYTDKVHHIIVNSSHANANTSNSLNSHHVNHRKHHNLCNTFKHEIDTLVMQNTTKSILYLISHDNSSNYIANKFAFCHEKWIYVVNINSTIFFESIIYEDLLPSSQHIWENYNYVITATYKSVTMKGQTLHAIKALLEHVSVRNDYDVIPFLRSGSKNMEFCLYFHKNTFKVAWDSILKELGYYEGEIRKYDDMKVFYRNIYIIKPNILKQLIVFMNKAIFIAKTNANIAQLLAQDSHYKEGSVEVARKVFGTDYYQLYPFVFERLPSFFLHSINASICHDVSGPCQYNT